MKVQQTGLEGCYIIMPDKFTDNRGSFTEIFDEQYNNYAFCQDNLSVSKINVFRGLHIQLGGKQGKLVTCINGIVTDFVVDLRPSSKTFKQWRGINLYGATKDQIFIPGGFAHGFYSHTYNTIIHYKTTELYNKSQERTLYWRDPILDINYYTWNIRYPLLSIKDQEGMSLSELEKEL